MFQILISVGLCFLLELWHKTLTRRKAKLCLATKFLPVPSQRVILSMTKNLLPEQPNRVQTQETAVIMFKNLQQEEGLSRGLAERELHGRMMMGGRWSRAQGASPPLASSRSVLFVSHFNGLPSNRQAQYNVNVSKRQMHVEWFQWQSWIWKAPFVNRQFTREAQQRLQTFYTPLQFLDCHRGFAYSFCY